MTDHPSDSLLTIDQACARLHVSRATMFRVMSEDPDLRWLKIGKRTLFRPEDITAYTTSRDLTQAASHCDLQGDSATAVASAGPGSPSKGTRPRIVS